MTGSLPTQLLQLLSLLGYDLYFWRCPAFSPRRESIVPQEYPCRVHHTDDNPDSAHYALNLGRNAFLLQHIVFHVLVVTGIALAAVGVSNLSEPAWPSNSYSSDTTLIETGYMLLLVTIVILAIYAAYIVRILYRTRPVTDRPAEERHASGIKLTNATSLVQCTMIAIVFAAVRMIYGVVYAFSSNKEKLSPVTGGFAIKFLLIFGV